MSDESAIGTSTGAILILVAIIVIAGITIGAAFPSVRESFKEVLNIQQDVFKDDSQTSLEDEAKVANELAVFFQEKLKTSDIDCLKTFSLKDFKNKNLGIDINGKLFRVVTRRGAGVRDFGLEKDVFFMREGIKIKSQFSITDDLERINQDVDMGNGIYFSSEGVYLLDELTSIIYSGVYSDIFSKKTCEAEDINNLKIQNLNGDSVVQEFLNYKINYLDGDRTIGDLIVYIIDLSKGNVPNKLDHLDEMNQVLRKSSTDYFTAKYGKGTKNLRILVPYKNIQSPISTVYYLDFLTGDIPGSDPQIATITLSDGTEILVRFIK